MNWLNGPEWKITPAGQGTHGVGETFRVTKPPQFFLVKPCQGTDQNIGEVAGLDFVFGNGDEGRFTEEKNKLLVEKV